MTGEHSLTQLHYFSPCLPSKTLSSPGEHLYISSLSSVHFTDGWGRQGSLHFRCSTLSKWWVAFSGEELGVHRHGDENRGVAFGHFQSPGLSWLGSRTLLTRSLWLSLSLQEESRHITGETLSLNLGKGGWILRCWWKIPPHLPTLLNSGSCHTVRCVAKMPPKPLQVQSVFQNHPPPASVGVLCSDAAVSEVLLRKPFILPWWSHQHLPKDSRTGECVFSGITTLNTRHFLFPCVQLWDVVEAGVKNTSDHGLGLVV